MSNLLEVVTFTKGSETVTLKGNDSEGYQGKVGSITRWWPNFAHVISWAVSNGYTQQVGGSTNDQSGETRAT